MKLITRDTDYAVRALCYIARQKNNIIPVSDLVEKLGVPRPFLRKLLQTLQKEGVLDSHKGKGGGFILAAKPKDISLCGLIEIFQGPVQVSEHLFKKKKCIYLKRCKLKKKIDEIESYLIKELKSINIARLINS